MGWGITLVDFLESMLDTLMLGCGHVHKNLTNVISAYVGISYMNEISQPGGHQRLTLLNLQPPRRRCMPYDFTLQISTFKLQLTTFFLASLVHFYPERPIQSRPLLIFIITAKPHLQVPQRRSLTSTV